MKPFLIVFLISLRVSLLSAQQPELIKDIIPGSSSSTFLVQNIAFTLDSFYFFQADDGVHGPELWVTDGSNMGTKLLKNIDPSSSGSEQIPLIVFNHVAYFYSTDTTTSATSIWRTDGTPDGTYKFFDECTASSKSPLVYGIFGDKMLFSGANNGLNELWVTDGTIGNTMLLKQLNTNSGDSKPGDFKLFQGQLYFSAEKNSFNRELWRTDGTPEGTDLFIDLTGTANKSSQPRYLGVVGDHLYFTAVSNDSIGRELWRTDGTIIGTELVKDVNPGTGQGIDYYQDIFTVIGNNLLFVADDGIHGKEWWVTNETTNVTELVKDIVPGSNGSNIAGVMLTTDSFTLFLAVDADHGKELWRTDGTAAGTFLVKDIYAGSNNGIFSPESAVLNGKVYFRGSDATYAEEVWVSDGTTAGTVRLTNTTYNLGQGNAQKQNLKIINNYLYFTMPSNQTGWEVWKLKVEEISGTANLTNDFSLVLYPNPASELVRITGYLNEVSSLNITLTNMQGTTISSRSYGPTSGAFSAGYDLDTSLPGGLYILTIQTNSGIKSIPFSIINK